jgi:excisionase family DNA binding protein
MNRTDTESLTYSVDQVAASLGIARGSYDSVRNGEIPATRVGRRWPVPRIDKTPEGRYRAYFPDPAGKQRSKTFRTKRDASLFLAEIEMSKRTGAYVAPNAGRDGGRGPGKHIVQTVPEVDGRPPDRATSALAGRDHPDASRVPADRTEHAGVRQRSRGSAPVHLVRISGVATITGPGGLPRLDHSV